MIVAVGVGSRIPPAVGLVLDCVVVPAVVVSGFRACIVDVGVAAVAGQDVVKVEHEDVVVRIAVQPVVDQPVVKGAGV